MLEGLFDMLATKFKPQYNENGKVPAVQKVI